MKYNAKITVIDDGTVDNEHRLGAVKDIAFVIETCNIQDDMIVLAGDNLTDFSLKGFVEYFMKKQATCIMRHYEPSVEKLRRTGVIQIDENDKVFLCRRKRPSL